MAQQQPNPAPVKETDKPAQQPQPVFTDYASI